MTQKNITFSVTLFSAVLTAVLYLSNSVFAAESDTMRQYQMAKVGGADEYSMVLKSVHIPVPAVNEVLVKMRAVSLNRKDIYALDRARQSGAVSPGLSISDGAGDVVAIGKNVSRFKIGDRVVAAFDTQWVDGESTGYKARTGMLSEFVLVTEETLLLIPEYLSYEEAATLPCAAVTAWNTLFKAANLQKDEYVLLQGTGGVSIFGLQLAVAAGAKPIITSSKDAKLEKARALGAVGTVNYRKKPDWQHDVRAITNDVGVKHVLEVGGKDTFPKAVASLADGGHIGSIGGLSAGGFIREVPEEILKPYNASWTYIYVGSRTDFENMNAFMSEHKIHPVIDRVFPFEEAPAAYEFMVSSTFFGKIVIAVNQ